MWNAVLAAEEDASKIDVLNALPGIERSLERGGVVGGADPGVVEENVDAPELLPDLRVEVLDLVLVGDIRLDRQLTLRARVEVHHHEPPTLFVEDPRRLGPDAAGGTCDHAYLPLQPSGHRAQPPSVA